MGGAVANFVSYVVAKENLGMWPGLVAAAALLIGYVLTVSVSVAAGIAAITSAFPVLFSHRVELCALGIVLVMWANLRGVKESGTIFAIPTYGFILILLAMIAVGVFRLAMGSLTPVAAPGIVAVEDGTEPLTLLLLMRAFASGCTAMTGIEAISNGIPAFRKPEASNAGINDTPESKSSSLSYLIWKAPSFFTSLECQVSEWLFGS